MNSPDHSTKGTPSARPTPKTRSRLRLLVGAGFQGLFHPPRGVLFTFPSRYSCTIGGQGYYSLGGWSPLLPTGFLVSRGTRVRGGPITTAFAYGALTRSGAAFQPLRLARPHGPGSLLPRPTTPRAPRKDARFGPTRFARRYSGPLTLISLPRGTEMFQFPRCPSRGLCIQPPMTTLARRGLPHSDSGGSSLACSSPPTFRRSPRPSSALGPSGIPPAPFSAWR